MQLAHDHLTLDGVFVQWMNVIFMDEDLMRSLTATLLSVFGEVRVYRPDPNTVVFLASDQPLNPELQLAQTGYPLRSAPLHYARFGINNAEDLLAALVLDAEGARRIAAGAPLITDDDNRIATSSVYERSRGMTGDTSGRLVAALDPLQRADSIAYGALRDKVSFQYIARRISVFSALDTSVSDRVARMAQILHGDARGEYLRAFYYRMTHQLQRSSQLLRLAIDDYPADDSLRLDYLRGSFNQLAVGKAPPEIVEVAAKLNPRPASILAAAGHAARNEWREVAMADPQLAEVPWTDVWYAEALELRVDWRVHVTNDKERKRFGDEAIMMIDRLAIMSPTLNLYALRMRAGFTAGRPEVVVESVSNYTRLARGMVSAGINPPESLHQDAKALTETLNDVATLPGVDAMRMAEVRAEIRTISPD
jgi:hypothetical protein